MIDKNTRKLIAEACDDILSCGENKRFWRKMKSVALNASDEDFDAFIQESFRRKDGLELLVWLDIQVGFINELNSLCDIRDFPLGDHAAVFHVSEENSDLWQVSHLTEDRIKRYNINGTNGLLKTTTNILNAIGFLVSHRTRANQSDWWNTTSGRGNSICISKGE